jgi:hypothetical protein
MTPAAPASRVCGLAASARLVDAMVTQTVLGACSAGNIDEWFAPTRANQISGPPQPFPAAAGGSGFT